MNSDPTHQILEAVGASTTSFDDAMHTVLAKADNLTWAVGKSRAMEMALTGKLIDAAAAGRLRLVSRVVSAATLIDETLKFGKKIASPSAISIALAKKPLNAAFETTLTEGLRYERLIFLSLFGAPDHKDGMVAFVEKRKPHFI